jgi:putative restriction endonuclease
MKSEGVFVRKFQNLHRDSIPGRWTEATLGRAPHKPLLLLCVIDSYRENAARHNSIEPTFYMEESFDAYWRKLFEIENSSTFAFPFFHLQHDGFWSLVGTNGSDVADPAIARAASALRNAVAFAKVDPELHDLLGRPEWNCHLRSVVITSNFDPEVHARLVER